MEDKMPTKSQGIFVAGFEKCHAHMAQLVE